MKSLPIIWQRLVSSDGKTCDRCDATYREMQRAVGTLKEALRPLGIEPALETRAMDERSFRADPSESNRIWIAGRPMEEWLGAKVGSSRCCAVCGEAECRTVQVGTATFETIPESLLLKAALIAAARLLDPATDAPPRPDDARCCET
jgi:anti-sigma factor RsiW